MTGWINNKSYKEQIDISYLEDIKSLHISKISWLKNSIILNKNFLWDSFHLIFWDNIQYITNAISAYQSWWKNNLDKKQLYILKKIEHIHNQSLKVTEEIIDDLFKDFLAKNFKTKDGINYIKKYWKIPFLNEELYKENSLSIQWKNIAKDIYLLSVNYITSYYRWLDNISEMFTKSLKWKTKIDKNIQIKIQNIASSFSNRNLKESWVFIIQLLYMIYSSVDEKIFIKIEENIKAWRVKTFSSSIKKLLKSSKYRDQFLKEWVLWDQLGFLCEFKTKKELKDIAKKLYKEYENWKNISKFNDRWILKRKYDNKDTLEWLDSFLNVWIMKDNIPLWEISLRYEHNNIICNLVENYKKHNNIQSFFRELIMKIDNLNHEIYKLSQDIKILRQLIVDIWSLPKQINAESRANKYLKNKVEKIKGDILKHIDNIIKTHKLDINIDDSLNNNIISYIIYDILKEKLWYVIHDLAWEKIVDEIKHTNSYKQLKDTEKIDYLERLSLKYQQQVDYDKKNNWKKTLTNYSEEIKKIYRKYKSNYSKIFKTAIFYKQTVKNKNTLEQNIKTQLKTLERLFKNFK